MPFPINEKYVNTAEEELGMKFPSAYRTEMMKDNGGEATYNNNDDYWLLFPIFIKENNKMIARTCNHLVLENKTLKKDWDDFPQNGVAIASDGSGNYLVLLNDKGAAQNEIYIWDHETGELSTLVDDFSKLTVL